MIPDVLGYELEEGLKLFREAGIDCEDILLKEYTSPKVDIIGDSIRIVRVNERCGKITIIVSSF